jgi:hypothetical protein
MLLLVTAAAIVPGNLASADPTPHPGRLYCGDVVRTSITLTADVENCPNWGLVIGADHITVDLNGHTVGGDGSETSPCPDDHNCDIGIYNPGHSDVTIRNGSIKQFRLGVAVYNGASRNRITQLTVSEISGGGVVTIGTTRTTMDHNRISGGVIAVVVVSSSSPRVTANTASGTSGYAVSATDDTHGRFTGNVLTSDKHGFLVGGTGNVVTGNVVSDSGSGIDVAEGAATTRVEHNHLNRVGDGIGVGNQAIHTLVRHNVTNAVGGEDIGGFGLVLDGPAQTVVDHNVFRASSPTIAPAIYIGQLDATTPARDNLVTNNVLSSKNGDGIYVDPTATGTILRRNLTAGSGNDGIQVQAAGTTITRNTAVHNHNLGIEAVAGVIDGGGNRAAGNGNPLQCTGVICR